MAALHPDLIVNGEKVPHSVLAAEVQNHDAPKGKPGIAWRKAANAIAVRTLLLQEARRQGISATPAAVGPDRFETNEEALIRGLLEAAITVDPPAEADILAEWNHGPERFRSHPLWEVSHILMACDPRDESDKQAALARATPVLANALANPKAFSRLAQDHSDCGSKSSGGALGQLGPGDTVPEFETALRDLAEGEITAEPVLTRHGWHIIRMDGVAKGQILPFEAVKPHIRDALEKKAWTISARNYVSQLKAAATISGADLQPVGADVH
ncbi:MAG: peptidylprolyl isomerase [Paracoccaceae bacterium]|jgi:peptidyl-prolyl cis-trans isomerase C|nr:peptidylprolyl isomerase [Paracoccaceae bacterium]MDP7184574.1 peptidylprolyl isomerase [Paracoccaceae bacterium]